MWRMLWPLLLVVGANCFYHVCAKSMPETVNAFGALTVTYLIGAAVSAAVFFTSVKPVNALAELRNVNWTSFAFGLAIVGLEAGNLFLYRAGWKVSTGALSGYICSALGLLFIGVLLYHETVSLRQALGMLACAAGLLLITK